MCVGENCAPQAIHYMNAQLAALHDNAKSCVDGHSTAGKTPQEYKYSHALAKYSFVDSQSKGQQTMFQADFARPELDFVCNHDAILRLKITSGLYRIDYNKTSNMTYSQKDIVQHLKDVQLAFRVSFDTRDLHGKDAKIGGGHNLIQLIVLNLPSAQLISSEPAIIIGRDAFVYYLQEYLDFLHQAGNHVLFSLPDFDDDRYRLTIDYSLMRKEIPEIRQVHGISVDKINAYLSSAWLKAAMALGDTDRAVTDWKHTCLAEYRSHWTHHSDSDIHFHAKLGAPRIQPVCSREVILFFSIDEVSFYDTADFEAEALQIYSEWEIAVLVDVIHEKDVDGHVTRCRLDLASARPYHLHCSYGEIDETDEIVMSYWNRVLEFFTIGYLDILESVELHVIYHFDARWHMWQVHSEGEGSETDEGGEWTVSKGHTGTVSTSWTETITQCRMFGFDQITAISQSSLNAHFVTLWELRNYYASLSKWSFNQYFHAEFQPITMRLLSHNRAIVWVHMTHGHLRPLKNGKPCDDYHDHSFSDWHVAFEVDLKKCTHSAMHASDHWRSKFADSLVYKEHGHHKDRRLEHLYLDLAHAEYLSDFSTFEGLFDHDHHIHHHGHHHHGQRPIDKVQATIHYIREHYLPHLIHHGFHILHTVPIWISGEKELLPSCALTDVAFHVYAKTEITRHTWAHHHSTTSEPVIVVLGVTRYRQMPSTYLEYSANWIIRVAKGISHGTVCVSRSAFMEKRLLTLLTRINAVTTVVPKFYGIHKGVWKVDLTAWNKHDWRKDQDCNFIVASETDGVMKYKWEHRDNWNYEHQGSGDSEHGHYSLSCVTRNFVELPTATRHRSLDIKVWGEVELARSYKSHHHQGSAKSSAKWEALICVHTELDGLKVTVVRSPTVAFVESPFSGDASAAKFIHLSTKLEEHLPSIVDLSVILSELRAFEGIWKYGYAGTQGYCLANPVFTHHGDIMFELRPHSQQVVRTKSSMHLHAGSKGSTRRSLSRRSSTTSSFLEQMKTTFQAVVNGSSNGHAQQNGETHIKETTIVNGNGHAHVVNSEHIAYSGQTKAMSINLEEYKQEEIDADDDDRSFLVPQAEVVA